MNQAPAAAQAGQGPLPFVELAFSPLQSLLQRMLGRILGTIAGGGSSDVRTMHWSVIITFPDNSLWTLEGMRHASGRLVLYLSKTKTDAGHLQAMMKVGFGFRPITKAQVDQLAERQDFQQLGRYDIKSNSCQQLALKILRALGVKCPKNIRTAHRLFGDAKRRAAYTAACASAVVSGSASGIMSS